MKKFLAVAAVVIVVCCLSAQNAFARRGGGHGGGQGGQAANMFGYNYQAQVMRQQQMQQQMRYRYRHGGQNGMMQQAPLGTGGYFPQPQINGQPSGNANHYQWMYQQRMQNGAGQAGNGARNGAANRNMMQKRFRPR